MVLFSCELFSPALLIQQFSLPTVLGEEEAEKQNQVLTEMAEHTKKNPQKNL